MAPEAMLKFNSPCTAIVCAPTGGGKTNLLYQMLKNADGMFEEPPEFIYYCFIIRQPLFDEMERNIKNLRFHHGLPDFDTLKEWSSSGLHSIVVLDDCMNALEKDGMNISNLFTIYSHHMRLSVFLLVQNLFANSKHFRNISLNSKYFILFRNARDSLQVKRLASSMFPGQVEFMMDSYKKATSNPFGYLCIDISPRAVESYKLRTNILPGQDTVVYQPK